MLLNVVQTNFVTISAKCVAHFVRDNAFESIGFNVDEPFHMYKMPSTHGRTILYLILHKQSEAKSNDILLRAPKI